MKRILLLSLLLSFLTYAIAQTQQGNLKLRIIDSSQATPMVGAVVCITSDGERYLYNTTNSDGSVTFPNNGYGKYDLMATFMGYDTIRRSVTIDRSLVDLGTFNMEFESKKIDRVTVLANSIRTSQSGDTIIYNADSFKVSADAVAEGLLAKMPGITVDDGEVEAQGEEVKKVYLDGKEFFGEDVTIAMKNIPADIISKIEVFNKLSDEAEFTGFDDGDSYKAINIVTKTGMNRGQFGKFVAGYAYDGLYQVSANYSYFTANHRFSIVASSNNMNVKGFGSMDVGGKGGRGMISGAGSFSSGSSGSGLTTSSGVGLNYGGTFLEEKLKIDASYFYNLSDSETTKDTEREYITDDDELQRFYDAWSETTTDNYNHRVNVKLEYKPSSRHSIMMRPEFAFQDNVNSSYSLIDNNQSSNGIDFEDLNQIENLVSTNKEAYSVSNNLVYRVLLGMQGRNIMFSARGSYAQNDTRSLSSNVTSYPVLDDNVVKQDILNGSLSYNVSSNITYSEPIFNKSAMLTFKYDVNYRFSDADYLVYEWEQEENMFNPDYDPTSSNIYNSGYLTQNVGPGFMYSKAQSLQINANVSYQNSTLSNVQDMPVVTPSNQEYSFDNFVYSVNLRKTIDRSNSLRVMLRSNTSNPSVSNLQEVVKDSNPLYVSSGNSDLKPSYSNTLKATYTRSNMTKGRTFMAMLNGTYTNNSIRESTIMLLNADDTYILPNGESLEQYGQYSRPVNLDGDWNVGSSVTFGTPVNPLYCNLNFNLGANYREAPSILNEVENINRTSSYKGGLSLGSNISENVDFTLAYSGGYNITNYEDVAGVNASQNNEYLTQKVSAQFKFVFWGGITLFGNTTYSQYRGVTNDFNQEYVLCNVSIGKKIFKNKRGEISIGVNDLLNQTENFSRNITENYIENVVTNSIGRYYGIKFTFDLRKFNGRTTPMGDRPNREDGEMGMGGGHGGDRGGMGGGPGGRGGF